MPQYSFDANYKWKFYYAIDGDLPTPSDLQSIKVLLFPGSAHAVYSPETKFFPKVASLVQQVMSEHTHIRMFGSCFGL